MMTRLFGLLIFCALLSACSLSPYRVEQVNRVVETSRQTSLSCMLDVPDRCSDGSALIDLSEQDMRNGKHHLTLLEVGEDALLIRVHLIRAARETIELQNFIFRNDDSGELLLNELLTAARRGVKVRLLLDQLFSGNDLDYLVKLTLAHANFEIKFYNPSFNKAKMSKRDWISAVACCFRRFNQRMHNKLLVVDGLVGLMGGRNIADRYFDFDTNYDFKDRDVAVFGNTVIGMQHSFEPFWTSPKSVPVQHLRDVAKQLLAGTPEGLPPYTPPARFEALLNGVENQVLIRSKFIDPAFEVERLEYFSDLPRKLSHPEESQAQDITRQLVGVLNSAQQSVVIQSPYMVLSGTVRKVFRDLRVDNPQIELIFSTNSLASTDADTVYANTHKHKVRYVKRLGFYMYELKPFPVDAPEFFPRWSLLMQEKEQGISSKSNVSGDDSTIPIPAPRVGLHSKSFVVDGKIAMIGSHNFDPRSEGFNTENGIIVWDEAFAQKLENLIRRDIEPQNSWVVAMKASKEVQESLEADEHVRQKAKYDTRFYGATSLYELIPGREPVPPDSPNFYRNYFSVGSFPEVVKTRRQINILFLGSFFGFLEPIL